MNERLGDIFTRVHQEFDRTHAVTNGRFVSVQDLLYASLNGLSSEIQFTIPPIPKLAKESTDPQVQHALRIGAIPDDALAITAREDAKLFQHLLYRMLVNASDETVDDLQVVKKQGIAIITQDFYHEYLEILQEASRYLRRESARLGPDLAEYSAIMAVKNLRHGVNPCAASQSLIGISSVSSDGVTLSVLGRAVPLQLDRNSTIFVAGAGYNALQDLEVMRSAPEFKFVLNDKDPFITKVLEHATSLYRAPNIIVAGGDMGAVLDRFDTVNAVIVSNVPTASEDEITSFGKLAEKKLRAGAPIHICQVENPAATGLAPASAWTRILKLVGFATLSDQRAEGEATVVSPAERAAWVDDSPETLVEKLRNREKFLVPRTFRYFAGRLISSIERMQN